MDEFIAYKAAVELLKESGQEQIIHKVYDKIKAQQNLPREEMVNYVKDIYAPFTDEQVADRIAAMLTPSGIKADVKLVFQTIEGLHKACPEHTGDWYFSGDYPTPGGVRFVCNAFVNWYNKTYSTFTNH
jgi:amidophosphoribosyltransferase